MKATCKKCGKTSEMHHCGKDMLMCGYCTDIDAYPELQKTFRITREFSGYVRGDVVFEAKGFSEEELADAVEVSRTTVRDDTAVSNWSSVEVVE